MSRLVPGILAVALATAPAGAFHTSFDFHVDRLEVDGSGLGPGDGVPDLIDEFDDGVRDWTQTLGTVEERGGLLHLQSPGTHYQASILVDVSEALSPFLLADSAGDFTITSYWDPVLPGPGNFVHMTLWQSGGTAPEFFGIAMTQFEGMGPRMAQHRQRYTSGGWGAPETQEVAFAPEEVSGRILLRIAFDDDTNLAMTSFSLDGGTTFQTPFAPVPVFTDGRNAASVLLGADPQGAPQAVPPICGNGVAEAGEQCDLGRQQNGRGCCTRRCQLLDADGDGLCDPLDGCPSVPSAGPADADGDGLDDACDACIATSARQRTWERPLVVLSGLNDASPGNESLRLRGLIPAGAMTRLAPDATGVRIQVRSLDGGAPQELVAPAGPGWSSDRGGMRWRFDARRHGGPSGVRRMTLSVTRPGATRVRAVAGMGAMRFDGVVLPPLQAAVALGDTATCAEIAFRAAACSRPGGARIVCGR